MHYDENNPGHPHHRDPRRESEQHHQRHGQERNFNDFRSRWGEPAPPLDLRREERQPDDRFKERGRYHHDWRPDERQGRRHQDNYNQEPEWRRRDADFGKDNQRADDRWQQHTYMPHPSQRHPRRDTRDDYWRDRERRDERDR